MKPDWGSVVIVGFLIAAMVAWRFF